MQLHAEWRTIASLHLPSSTLLLTCMFLTLASASFFWNSVNGLTLASYARE